MVEKVGPGLIPVEISGRRRKKLRIKAKIEDAAENVLQQMKMREGLVSTTSFNKKDGIKYPLEKKPVSMKLKSEKEQTWSLRYIPRRVFREKKVAESSQAVSKESELLPITTSD